MRAGWNRNGPLWITAACAAPGALLRFAPHAWPAPGAALAFGATVAAAAFVLAWAAEAAEQDLSRGVALALLALVAVLPEFAVDGTFAWLAGRHPGYLAFPLANMTGANRILIGWGWPLVVAVVWKRHGARRVSLDRAQLKKVAVLLAATAFSFWIAARRSLTLFDAIVLLGLFALYVWRLPTAAGAPSHAVGMARRLAERPRRRRRWLLAALVSAAAAAILLVSEPFARALVAAGSLFGVSQFYLVQWLAPLASELPEFVVVSIFAWHAAGGRALEALISSKVSQWTLLVSLLPVIYSLSRGHWTALPLTQLESRELLLTGAQSLFAALILLDLALDRRDAAALWVLFTVQLAVPEWRLPVTAIYFALAALALVRHRRGVARAARALWRSEPAAGPPPAAARDRRR
ncbi:MAG TPA: hypothetical protein VE996_02785 [Terriglobales bacterium]|nr:hypothetical protein [Terriglobales bacterium]